MMRLSAKTLGGTITSWNASAGQNLAGLAMNLAQLEDEAKGEPTHLSRTIKDAKTLVDALTRGIRTMSYLLHPPMLDEMGLPSALSDYAEGLAKRSGLSIEMNIPDDFGRLAPEVEPPNFVLCKKAWQTFIAIRKAKLQ